MDALLEELCNLFDDELERQENVLAVCRAQYNAARAHDFEYLEAKTAALVVLLRDGTQAARKRHGALREIVDHYGLPVERQTLTDLIAVVPDPWHRRLLEFQHRFREVLEAIREVVRQSGRFMRRSLSILDECLGALEQCSEAAPGAYDADGLENRTRVRLPAFIDRKG